MRRVVITGLGCVSAMGLGRQAFWDSIRAGRSAIRPLSILPPENLGIQVGAEVTDYDPSRHFDAKRLSLMDRFLAVLRSWLLVKHWTIPGWS